METTHLRIDTERGASVGKAIMMEKEATMDVDYHENVSDRTLDVIYGMNYKNNSDDELTCIKFAAATTRRDG